MHSIAHFILEKNPSCRIVYTTSEEFTNELIEAIRNGNNTAMTKFREKYRNIDVLLIDDIQFIIGKESTQEEFFHTFNSCTRRKSRSLFPVISRPRIWKFWKTGSAPVSNGAFWQTSPPRIMRPGWRFSGKKRKWMVII